MSIPDWLGGPGTSGKHSTGYAPPKLSPFTLSSLFFYLRFAYSPGSTASPCLSPRCSAGPGTSRKGSTRPAPGTTTLLLTPTAPTTSTFSSSASYFRWLSSCTATHTSWPPSSPTGAALLLPRRTVSRFFKHVLVLVLVVKQGEMYLYDSKHYLSRKGTSEQRKRTETAVFYKYNKKILFKDQD